MEERKYICNSCMSAKCSLGCSKVTKEQKQIGKCCEMWDEMIKDSLRG